MNAKLAKQRLKEAGGEPPFAPAPDGGTGAVEKTVELVMIVTFTCENGSTVDTTAVAEAIQRHFYGGEQGSEDIEDVALSSPGASNFEGAVSVYVGPMPGPQDPDLENPHDPDMGQPDVI